MRYVVNVSGGLTSYKSLERIISTQDKKDIIPIFADTLIEDVDLYRFLDDIERVLDISLIRLTDGRTPFDVWRDKRAITMQSAAMCSKVLKTELINNWLHKQHWFYDDYVTLVFGMDWDEGHRIKRLTERYAPISVYCPLAERPYLTKYDIIEELKSLGIKPPRLYGLGFHHNNCGGGCVRAGKGAWIHLLKTFPDRFAMWEREEIAFQAFIGKSITIVKGISLTEIREKVERENLTSMDFGGCGCFVDDER